MPLQLPAGMRQRARTGFIDPPWKFGDPLPGAKRGAVRHYELLDVEEIAAAYDVPALMLPDSRIVLWRVSSMQREALDLLDLWGFELKAELVWRKLTKTGKLWFGMGHQTRAAHETALIAVRGKPRRKSASVRSVFDAPWAGHSVKPDRAYEIVRELSPGPFLELFARRPREGWTTLGLELEK